MPPAATTAYEDEPALFQSLLSEQARLARRRAHQPARWTRPSVRAKAKDDTMLQEDTSKLDLFLLDDHDHDEDHHQQRESFDQSLQQFNLKLRLSSQDHEHHLCAERLDDERRPSYFKRYQRQRSLRQHQMSPMQHSPHCVTLEELKVSRNSCWLCGCNWQQDHVSLDCPECDGYALSRPCPSCDGRCQQVWQRNISATHDHHKALWVGQCSLKATSGSYCSASESDESDSSHHSLCN